MEELRLCNGQRALCNTQKIWRFNCIKLLPALLINAVSGAAFYI